jgi:hypothetical protein
MQREGIIQQQSHPTKSVSRKAVAPVDDQRYEPTPSAATHRHSIQMVTTTAPSLSTTTYQQQQYTLPYSQQQQHQCDYVVDDCQCCYSAVNHHQKYAQFIYGIYTYFSGRCYLSTPNLAPSVGVMDLPPPPPYNPKPRKSPMVM